MSGRTIVRAVSAALGGLLVLASFLPAHADPTALATFGARSIGRGLEATLGPREVVIEPLAHVAVGFTRTEMNSIPQSNAIAAVVFPGDLANSVLDEEGTAANAGAPFAWPFSLGARLDPAKERRDRERSVVNATFTERFGVYAQTGRMRALAEERENRAHTAVERVVVQPDPKAPPVVEIEAIASHSTSFVDGRETVQRTLVRASGISLLDGAIEIGSITSRTEARSNGVSVSGTVATTEIAGVTVTDSAGRAYRAVIDDRGIRIDDPTVSRSVEQSVNAQLSMTLAKLGIDLATQEESIVTDGATATAATGGVLIRFAGACEACPSVLRLLPSEARRVVTRVPDVPSPVGCIVSTGPDSPLPSQVPKPLPLCLTLALVPTSPNLAGSLTLGAAFTQVAASIDDTVFDECVCPVDPGAHVPIEPVVGDPPFEGGASAPGHQIGGAPNDRRPTIGGPLMGTFAEMPDGALAVGGSVLLFLAVALGFAPSLRRGSAS